jgi:hypothetical protein
MGSNRTTSQVNPRIEFCGSNSKGIKRNICKNLEKSSSSQPFYQTKSTLHKIIPLEMTVYSFMHQLTNTRPKFPRLKIQDIVNCKNLPQALKIPLEEMSKLNLHHGKKRARNKRNQHSNDMPDPKEKTYIPSINIYTQYLL